MATTYALQEPAFEPLEAAAVIPQALAIASPQFGEKLNEELNPVLDTLEAGRRGEIRFQILLTEQQRAARRAIIANPPPPTETLKAGLAAYRASRHRNDIR